MPGRSFTSSTGYRYGFNGQEKDIEIFEGAYTSDYWEYDSRIIRRWNRDPIVKPWESSYLCFSGNPIYFADPSGADGENPDGSCPGDAQFPANPKDGQEHIRYDQKNNANWGYVYDGNKKEWIETGASVTLNPVTVEDKYTPTGLRKWGGQVAYFLTHSHFTAKFSGEVNVGAVISAEREIYGQDASIELNAFNINLLEGEIDLANPSDYSGHYAGKNNITKMTAGASIGITDYFTAGYEKSWDATNLMSDMNSGYKNENETYNVTFGIPILRKIGAEDLFTKTLEAAGQSMLPELGVKNERSTKEKNFFGLDFSVSAQVILGGGAGLKIGLEED